ncbi:hypothetical protein NQ317_006858, partial [Molorchus minor]
CSSLTFGRFAFDRESNLLVGSSVEFSVSSSSQIITSASNISIKRSVDLSTGSPLYSASSAPLDSVFNCSSSTLSTSESGCTFSPGCISIFFSTGNGLLYSVFGSRFELTMSAHDILFITEYSGFSLDSSTDRTTLAQDIEGFVATSSFTCSLFTMKSEEIPSFSSVGVAVLFISSGSCLACFFLCFFFLDFLFSGESYFGYSARAASDGVEEEIVIGDMIISSCLSFFSSSFESVKIVFVSVAFDISDDSDTVAICSSSGTIVVS